VVDTPEVLSPTGKLIQWLQRITMLFVGSLMVGMSLTLVFVSSLRVMALLLTSAVLVVGFTLIAAGIRNKPPNLNFIPGQVPKRKRGSRRW
jgi:hypothetical protein